MSAIRQFFIGDGYELIGIEQVETLQGIAESHAHVIRYFGFALGAFLRGDHHHTGSRTRTEDRGGRTILEHLDALDVGGVDVSQCVGVGSSGEVTRDDGYSVDYEQRTSRLVDGVYTADEYPSGLVHQTAGVGDLHTGRTTGQLLVYRRRDQIREFLRVDLRCRTGKRFFLLSTVSHHYDFLHDLVLTHQCGIDRGKISDVEFLGDHIDRGDYQDLCIRGQ